MTPFKTSGLMRTGLLNQWAVLGKCALPTWGLILTIGSFQSLRTGFPGGKESTSNAGATVDKV